MTTRRAIPAVGKVLDALADETLPRPLVTEIVRQYLAALRESENIPGLDAIVRALREQIEQLALTKLQPVINGTGIVLHTNLGRAPLGPTAVERIAQVAASYSNLEYDLAAGSRGSRAAYLERLLALACESEAATVVNNCAAALILILRHFTSGKREVIISRGELIQIGGGFRIPEILEASGAKLREVGTTNRTVAADYAAALSDETALILKVHRSNFHMEGFVESAVTEELAPLAQKAGVPLVEDLGSGALFATEHLAGLDPEPTPAAVLARGVDLVCFSGDKLFGGPQAGIIAGRATLVKRLKADPLFRALRCDKLVFAALEATAELHLAGALAEIPAYALLARGPEELRQRAEAIVVRLDDLPLAIGIAEVEAEVGGGTLPRSRVPSVALSLVPRNGSLDALAARLRHGAMPVIGYLAGNRFLLDLRTVFPAQDETLIHSIRAAVSER